MRWRTNQRHDDPFTTVPRPSLRRPLAATTATILGLSLATLIPAERAVGAPAVPSFCAGTAPIVASAIGPSVDIRTCAIQGRLVVLPVAGGSDSIGVHVPAAGQGVGNAALAVDGEYELTVTNTGDAVTIEYSTPDTATATGPVASGNGTVVPDADPACNETAFNLEGHKWTSTVRWFYNESSVSRAGLNLSATIADIRGGNFNMTTGQNNCGFATGAFSASGAFQGDTSLFANIDSSGTAKQVPGRPEHGQLGPVHSREPPRPDLLRVQRRDDDRRRHLHRSQQGRRRLVPGVLLQQVRPAVDLHPRVGATSRARARDERR